MNNPKTGHFRPDRRLGVFIHAIVIAVLAAVSVFGLVNLSQEQVGPFFVMYLLISLLAFMPIPFLGYRAYALLRADYYIDRDSLAMLWGLRIEDMFIFLLYSDTTTPVLKLLRNPDVTVRTRGVMEKCMYCVQRIEAVKIEAKNEQRPIRDGEIVTACQQACPTQAIVFGDLNDANSRVRQLQDGERSYGVLAEIYTKPRTMYLAKIRNVAGEGKA